jgi:penicillin-binding protein 1A
MDSVWSYLRNFGLEHLTAADQVESLALGGTNGGVTNLEITAAYSAIANGGTYIEPHYYTQVLDREGNVLLTKTPERRTVLQSSTAALLTSAMEDVLTSGTGTAASFGGMDLAGKSGTTTDLRDLWFVGYSPYYACGVWGGYDDNSAQSSSTYVKSIWKAVMKRAHADLSRASFSEMGTLTTSTICTKCGNLAVDGLCDDTVQGNMTYSEKFAHGTAPTENCTCHTEVKVCQTSGQKASIYCPETETQVYLNSGTAGTADADYVLPSDLEETCSVHQHWWNWFLPGEGASQEDGGNSSEEPRRDTPERNDNWWNWFDNWGW